METPGSIAVLIAELVTVEETVGPSVGAAIRVYPLRPTKIPELPAIYNWIDESPADWTQAIGTVKETINLQARLAIAHGDEAEEQYQLLRYADAFREAIDSALKDPGPAFNGAASFAERTQMRTVFDVFNDIDVLCLQFTFKATLNRVLLR